MSSSVRYLTPTLCIVLAVMGLFALIGAMEGKVYLFLLGLALLFVASEIWTNHTLTLRVEKFPEHAVIGAWDNEIGDYVYSYRYYGRAYSTGDKEWAERIAKHYNVRLTIEEASDE